MSYQTLPDLFPLDPPATDSPASRAQDLMLRLCEDVELFAQAVDVLNTSASADLVSYLHGTWMHAEGADPELRRLLVKRVRAWVDAKVSE